MDGTAVMPRGDGEDDRQGRAWSLADIPYDTIDRARIADDEVFFNLLASASFIEITSDTYTRNLAEFCAGDDEVVEWLRHGWEPEEMQHGACTRLLGVHLVPGAGHSVAEEPLLGGPCAGQDVDAVHVARALAVTLEHFPGQGPLQVREVKEAAPVVGEDVRGDAVAEDALAVEEDDVRACGDRAGRAHRSYG